MRIAALFVAYSAIFTFDSASVLADEGVQTVASDHTLSEITVSARKRDENLEKVPASVTVVTSADLQVTYTGSLAASPILLRMSYFIQSVNSATPRV